MLNFFYMQRLCFNLKKGEKRIMKTHSQLTLISTDGVICDPTSAFFCRFKNSRIIIKWFGDFVRLWPGNFPPKHFIIEIFLMYILLLFLWGQHWRRFVFAVFGMHLDCWNIKIFSLLGGFVALSFILSGFCSMALLSIFAFSVRPRDRMTRMLIVHPCIMWSWHRTPWLF